MAGNGRAKVLRRQLRPDGAREKALHLEDPKHCERWGAGGMGGMVGGGAPGAPAAVVPVPDGPPEERSANRDRTPPPNKGSRKKKDFDKMSEAELAGPRKAKGSSSKTAA